jgi:hypothetical protein
MEFLNKKAKDMMANKENWVSESKDEPICAICEESVKDDVPLRFFNLEENTEIDFHIECAIGE